MKNSNHFNYRNQQHYMQPSQRLQNPSLLTYNLSNRTSPYRTRLPPSQNQQFTSTSNRTSPTMIMRNVASDFTSNYAMNKLNNDKSNSNFNYAQRPSTNFHNGPMSNFKSNNIANQKKKIISSKTIQNQNLNYRSPKEPNLDNLKFNEDKPAMTKLKIGRAPETDKSQKTVSTNLESLLTAHEKILSKALNPENSTVSGNKGPNQHQNLISEITKNYSTSTKNIKNDIHLNYHSNKTSDNKDTPGESKKDLIDNLRKAVLNRKVNNNNNEKISEVPSGNFNPQVYSNLQIVNSNIYFPVVKSGETSPKLTPIRVERKFRTDDKVRINSNKELLKKETNQNEETQKGNNLSFRYEDSLNILKDKVEEIKESLEKNQPEKNDGNKFNYADFGKKDRFNKIDEILQKEIEFKEKKKKKILKKKSTRNIKSKKEKQLKTPVKTEEEVKKNKEKKSKFLEASETRELNKFDLSLIENSDMEYDSMLLGRRKNGRKEGEKNYHSLQRNNMNPRFQSIKEKKKNYTNRYNNKKKSKKSREEQTKNAELLKLLDNDFDDEDDIDNIKFEVSSLNSDIGNLGLKSGKEKEKEKGYSDITNSKRFLN